MHQIIRIIGDIAQQSQANISIYLTDIPYLILLNPLPKSKYPYVATQFKLHPLDFLQGSFV